VKITKYWLLDRREIDWKGRDIKQDVEACSGLMNSFCKLQSRTCRFQKKFDGFVQLIFWVLWFLLFALQGNLINCPWIKAIACQRS